MTQVFISYSRKDLSFVEQLASDLENAGIDVWYDVSGIAGGARWRSEIENALRNSQYVIVVLSPDSIVSEWVEREFLFSSNLRLKIIPLMYRPCELPLNYVDLNYIDVQGENYGREFPDLLRALSVDPKAVALPRARTKQRAPGFTTVYLVLGIALIALIVGGLFIFQLNGNWFTPAPTLTSAPSAPETVAPGVPEPTSTSDPALIPISGATSTEFITPTTAFEASSPNPKMKKENVTSALMSDSFGGSLRSVATEQYSDGDYASRSEFTYTVSLGQSQELVWHWYWCARDVATLLRNLEHISVTFTLNGQEIPSDALVEDQYVGGDSVCRVYYVILYDWPAGTHRLLNTATIDQLINDGWDDYPAQERTYDYLVYINP